MKPPISGLPLLGIIMTWLSTGYFNNAIGQYKKQIVRLAKLIIDSTQVESYIALLKEGAETAVRVEPGVLTLYAIAKKEPPTHFTVLEIYAASAAYKAHFQTLHFIK